MDSFSVGSLNLNEKIITTAVVKAMDRLEKSFNECEDDIVAKAESSALNFIDNSEELIIRLVEGFMSSGMLSVTLSREELSQAFKDSREDYRCKVKLDTLIALNEMKEQEQVKLCSDIAFSARKCNIPDKIIYDALEYYKKIK
ncbi:MAG: hypothetical protein LBR98_04355 [Syntrophomonadaceae bacterium]|jgi:hypothetical protein|nr:hypothetical protein [Syntrophomonadaceae bacterium]